MHERRVDAADPVGSALAPLSVEAAAMSHSLDWMDKAACVGHPNPDLFFPESRGKGALAQAREAEFVCRTCPVRIECDQHRQITGASCGVWGGGLNNQQRLGRSPMAFGGPVAHGTERRYNQHIKAGEKPCIACIAAHSARLSPGGRSKYKGHTN